jgi:hypothetical protein
MAGKTKVLLLTTKLGTIKIQVSTGSLMPNPGTTVSVRVELPSKRLGEEIKVDCQRNNNFCSLHGKRSAEKAKAGEGKGKEPSPTPMNLHSPRGISKHKLSGRQH